RRGRVRSWSGRRGTVCSAKWQAWRITTDTLLKAEGICEAVLLGRFRGRVRCFTRPVLNRPQLANVIEDRGFHNKATDETHPIIACHIPDWINDTGGGNRCLDPAIRRPNNRQQLHFDRPKTL